MALFENSRFYLQKTYYVTIFKIDILIDNRFYFLNLIIL